VVSPCRRSTVRVSEGWMSNDPRKFLIAFAVAMAGFPVLAEIGYRAWLYNAYVVNAAYQVMTVDYPPPTPSSLGPTFGRNEGPYPPSTHFAMRQYGIDGALQRSVHVSTNNLGWVSSDDFSLPKPPGQFRLAILGDSLTASVTNDIPWPSVVQIELRKKLPQITIMNLGSPGMNTQLMALLTLPIAQRLAADAVIVNIPIENLDFPLVPKADQRQTQPRVQTKTLLIRGVPVPVFCFESKDDCQLNPTWNVPRGRELTESEVTEIKQIAARVALRNRLLWAPKSFLFSTQGVMQSAPIANPEEQIAAAVAALLEIKKAYPSLLVTINPLEWYYNPATMPAKSTRFISEATAAGLDVIDMREHLPEASADERHRWWNMPYDGHWSNDGAEIYGRAIADVVMQRLDGNSVRQAGIGKCETTHPC
jgi:hypothetical protein